MSNAVMKKLLTDFCTNYQKDITWFLVALSGWGAAFWFMPAEPRHTLFFQVGLLAAVTLACFIFGLLLRLLRVLNWLLIGIALALVFGSDTRHLFFEGDLFQQLSFLAIVLGFILASHCPPWRVIAALIHDHRQECGEQQR